MTDILPRTNLLPHEPPLVTSQLPALGGRVGSALEDFRVDEIPAYLPSGEGEHRFVKIEKRGLSTPEALTLIARTANAKERDIGTAGLKDKHAVTTQWLSLPRQSRPASEWQLPAEIRVLEESYHQNKLRTGHLHGNRFTLRLVELDADVRTRMPALVERLRKGTLNAFAEQRFGRDGQNIQSALEWLKDPRALRGPKARFLCKLYPSVIQSELFNRYLSRRLERGEDVLLSGEIVRLEGSGSNFVVEDLATEQARFARGDLHPQGPMFGPKMRPAKSEALELEQQVLSELGLTLEELDQLGAHAPGTRRDVWLRLNDFEASVQEGSAPSSDGATTPSVVLLFGLPAGSYATHVVRELTHGVWFERRRGPRESSASAIDGAQPDAAS
ncbi:MAG TPA: tRNA pseudouridine(13) synthase TruD [Polyangiaceae bacterium]|nr:tRNA pseudouridine(13) synthase TruD [Polyangiaceae bacterium]